MSSGLEGSLKDLESAAKGLSREDLIEAGGRVLEMALSRMEGRYTKNTERIKWARIVASIISATGGVMRDRQLDELEARISRLEEARK